MDEKALDRVIECLQDSGTSAAKTAERTAAVRDFCDQIIGFLQYKMPYPSFFVEKLPLVLRLSMQCSEKIQAFAAADQRALLRAILELLALLVPIQKFPLTKKQTEKLKKDFESFVSKQLRLLPQFARQLSATDVKNRELVLFGFRVVKDIGLLLLQSGTLSAELTDLFVNKDMLLVFRIALEEVPEEHGVRDMIAREIVSFYYQIAIASMYTEQGIVVTPTGEGFFKNLLQKKNYQLLDLLVESLHSRHYTEVDDLQHSALLIEMLDLSLQMHDGPRDSVVAEFSERYFILMLDHCRHVIDMMVNSVSPKQLEEIHVEVSIYGMFLDKLISSYMQLSVAGTEPRNLKLLEFFKAGTVSRYFEFACQCIKDDAELLKTLDRCVIFITMLEMQSAPDKAITTVRAVTKRFSANQILRSVNTKIIDGLKKCDFAYRPPESDRRSRRFRCCSNCGKQRVIQEAQGERCSLKKCSLCVRAFYCDAQCQKEHWDATHKSMCPKLREANRIVDRFVAKLNQVQTGHFANIDILDEIILTYFKGYFTKQPASRLARAASASQASSALALLCIDAIRATIS